MTRKPRYIPSVCASTEIARDNGEDAPAECAIHIGRKTARKFGDAWFCHNCLLRELQEHRQWQRRTFAEIDSRRSLHPELITDQDMDLWQKLSCALMRQRERRRAYARQWRLEQEARPKAA